MMLIDTHSHFDDPRLDECRDEAFRAAISAGVTVQIIPAVSAVTWPRVKSLCEKYSGCYPCYGLHPFFTDEHKSTDLDNLADWMERERAVAVGECGLDYFLPNPDKQKQKKLLLGQLELAADLNLPVVLHANRAVEDVTMAIRQSRVRRGVIHSFNGSYQQATQLIDLGFKLSFGGAVTYSRATKLRSLLKTLPRESILIETDAPDQPPSSRTGLLNQPAFLRDIFTTFCELMDDDMSTLANQLNRNAVDLFNLPPIPNT